MKPNQRLRRERELRGWSQSRVAQELGTDPATVSRWERGLSFPYPFFRERLCELFGKNAEELGLVQETPVIAPVEESPVLPALEGELSPVLAPSPPDPILDPAIPLLSAIDGSLIGRDDLLQYIRHQLSDPASRPALVALNGLPGVGKTSLAVALAHDHYLQQIFSEGILWAGLGPHPEVLEHLSRWGALLHIDEASLANKESCESWAQAIRFAIGQRHILIVIDDVWQIEDALSCQVGGPNCAFLLTTRFPHIALHFAAGNTTPVHELDENDGLALLARLAPHVVQDETESALELVRSVGGLPLALTLIGKYLRIQSYGRQPRRINAALTRLRDARERLQISEPRSLIDRHTSLTSENRVSLQAIIEVSDALLDLPARTGLRALSVFPPKPNSFSEEAALAVMALSQEVLDTLSDAGLLESNGPNRYTLHQTIADYARVLLEDNAVYTRFVQYFITYLEEHTLDYPLLDQESRNLHIALELAHTRQMHDAFLRCVKASSPHLFVRGRYSEAEKYFSTALELALSLQRLSDATVFLRDLGRIAHTRGNFLQAETYYQRGLRLAHQQQDTLAISRLLTHLGTIMHRRGLFSEAIAYFEDGLLYARQTGDQEQLSYILLGLAQAHGSLDHHKQAEEYAWESLEIAHSLGNGEHLADVLHRLGTLIYERGDYEQALGLLFESLDQASRITHREKMCHILNNIGCVLSELGDFPQSERYFQEAQELAQQINAQEILCIILCNLGCIANECGEYEKAEPFLLDGLVLGKKIGLSLTVCECLEGLGTLARNRYDYNQAEKYYQEGLARARMINNKRAIISMLTCLGATMTACLHFEDAERYLEEGLALARDINRPRQLCNLLYEYGKLEDCRQHPQRARAYFQEMLTTPAIGEEVIARARYGLARTAALEGDYATAHQLGNTSATFFARHHHRLSKEARLWLESLPLSQEEKA